MPKSINILECSLLLFCKWNNLQIIDLPPYLCSISPHTFSCVTNWIIPCSLNITFISCQSPFTHVNLFINSKIHVSKPCHLSSPILDVTSFMGWAKLFSSYFHSILKRMSLFFEVHTDTYGHQSDHWLWTLATITKTYDTVFLIWMLNDECFEFLKFYQTVYSHPSSKGIHYTSKRNI